MSKGPSSSPGAESNSRPPLSHTTIGGHSVVTWLGPAQLVAFLANFRNVIVLFGTSSPQNFLPQVALHYAGGPKPRATLGFYSIKTLADQAWILPLVEAVLPRDRGGMTQVFRGYYLFCRGEVQGYHPGLYDPRLDEKAQRAELLLRSGKSGASQPQIGVAMQQLQDIATEAATLVIQRFDELLSSRQTQPDIPALTRDPYEMLGVSPSASMQEIKNAYHAKMRELHPDRVAAMDDATKEEAHRRSQQVIQAYQMLRKHSGDSNR